MSQSPFKIEGAGTIQHPPGTKIITIIIPQEAQRTGLDQLREECDDNGWLLEERTL